ncbi:3-keto-5-aminohexanoate cleavage protein [Thioclava sp. BHET1]|nr:3-keto-5-aminohexanoate cleavage protein [Thioclava sp. BHET1]
MTRPFVMVAPNGARRGKADHPALPVTIPEIVATARDCAAAGADGLHLHVRDPSGQHSLDAGLYREALAGIAEAAPSLALQITTESAGIFDVPAQLTCLEAVQPGWVSIAVREIARAPEMADRIYGLCAAQGSRVQHILYAPEDARQLQDWQGRGIVRPGQDEVLLVLGRYAAGQISAPSDLAPLRAAVPAAVDWMICAFGPAEHACLAEAALQGGNLRVGFENSLVAADGTPHRDNAASVRDLRKMLERHGK